MSQNQAVIIPCTQVVTAATVAMVAMVATVAMVVDRRFTITIITMVAATAVGTHTLRPIIITTVEVIKVLSSSALFSQC